MHIAQVIQFQVVVISCFTLGTENNGLCQSINFLDNIECKNPKFILNVSGISNMDDDTFLLQTLFL